MVMRFFYAERVFSLAENDSPSKNPTHSHLNTVIPLIFGKYRDFSGVIERRLKNPVKIFIAFNRFV
jgi:hypothetical protein